jgi:methionyl-tRNA synthetase
MLLAEREGKTPEELIEGFEREHRRDYADFSIDFDHFHSTHSPENRFFSEQIYRRVERDGHIERRRVRQFFDPEREIFLADRFVRGTCPRCSTPDQNGDNCDNCGAVYEPRDLIDPQSVLSGVKPIEKESEHLFVKMSDFEGVLRAWVTPERLQPEVVNKLEEWFSEGLRDWDISRDAPYFGFEIPGAPGKYFYVWLDAPIGYMAAFKAYCDRQGVDFDEYWRVDSETELYHFIGKDILNFHCLFWPAMLHGGGYRMPTAVYVHGFLTVDGVKMSKSRGTFINARTYLDHLGQDSLRYYLAAKLGPGLGDLDFSIDDFVNRVNSDLVGKVVNIASRSGGLLHRYCDGRLGPELDAPELLAEFVEAGEEIAATFDGRDYNRAIRAIMALADRANRYIADREPWAVAKDESRSAELQAILTTALNLFRVLMVYLRPVTPALVAKAEVLMKIPPQSWSDASQPLLDHEIEPYEPLLTRVDRKSLEAMIEDSRIEGAEPG